MATWLITGATGFVGRHVLDVLDAELAHEGRTGDSIVVLGRRCPAGWPESQFVAADLDDSDGLRQAVGAIAPDHVIHTAGRTPPAADESLYRGNFWATIRLLNALRALNRRVRVTLAGLRGRARSRAAGRSAGLRVVSVQSRRCLRPEQVAGHGRRPGRAARRWR